MARSRSPKTGHLRDVVAALKRHYGPPAPPLSVDPLEMILIENVAYLVDDERRERVWRAFQKQIGGDPAKILAAGKARIAGVIREGGMNPDMRADKVLKTAQIAIEEFDGDLDSLVKQPLAKARKGLKLFPGVGDPGADKILMFARKLPVLALESNGLRALVRLGWGFEAANYAAMYRGVQEAIAGEISEDFDWLIEAHTLLRRHGQALCKRSKPLCGECPLRAVCPASGKQAQA